MTRTPGSRVFAVRSATKSTVEWFGFGVYAGDFPRPGTVDWDDMPAADQDMYRQAVRDVDEHPLDLAAWYDSQVEAGELSRSEADRIIDTARTRAAAERDRPVDERAAELAVRSAANPRIDLDAGGVVWGFQCWWGPADRFDGWVAGRELIEVPAPDVMSPDSP